MARLVAILILALIVLGPRDLPKIARLFWRVTDELRRTSADLGDALRAELEAVERDESTHPPAL